jgi:hypothetical protein
MRYIRLNLHITDDSNWETFAERRKIVRTCPLFEVYTGERASEAYVIDYKRHAVWTESITIEKSGTENKGELPEIIPL